MFDDHVWVEINLRKDDRLLYGCIYRSPTNEKAETIENTTKVCQLIAETEQRNNLHLLIGGDFNYTSIDWENEYVDENSSTIGSSRPFKHATYTNIYSSLQDSETVMNQVCWILY